MAPGIKNPDKVAEMIRRLGVKLRIIASRQARLKNRIERNQAKVDRDRKLLGKLNLKDQAVADRYALAIYRNERDSSWQDFTQQTSELVFRETTGIVRIYRASMGKLTFNVDEQETIAEIWRRFPDQFFHFVKCEIRRNNLKDDEEVLDALTTAQAERGLFCSIEPANTSKKYARSVAHFEQLLAPPAI